MAFFTLYTCLYWIIDFRLLFSENSIIFHKVVQLPWWKNGAFILFNNPTAVISALFIGLTIALAFYILFFKAYHRLAFFILWLSISNINNNVFCTMTGGDGLFQLLLFFCVFLGTSQNKEETFNAGFDIALHNFGITAIQIQVCIVYLLNAIAKLMDPDWLGGLAVADTLALKEFSLPFLYHPNETLAMFLNYAVIFYQLFFPVLVWIKKIKKPYLILGVIQHLFIAFIMGLPSFGLIMIMAYAAFYSPFKKN